MSKIEKNIKKYIVGKVEYTCRRGEWKSRKVMDIPGRHERKKKSQVEGENLKIHAFHIMKTNSRSIKK